MTDRAMSLAEHLSELRNRLVVYVIFLLPASLIAFFEARAITKLLLVPARGHLGHLIVTSPTEALFTYIKLAFVIGFIATSPVLLYEAAAFVAPALKQQERRLLRGYVPVTLGLFLLGVSFGYFVFLPVVLRFLLSFTGPTLVPLITLGRYIGFLVSITLPFGLVFETPMIAYAAARIGILGPDFLRRNRRVAVLVIFIVAGAVTPPDAFSMMLMVLPMWILFEVSILIAGFAVRQRR